MITTSHNVFSTNLKWPRCVNKIEKTNCNTYGTESLTAIMNGFRYKKIKSHIKFKYSYFDFM